MAAIEKQEMVSKMVTIGHICDVCGKKVESNYLPKDWLRFNHHHSDWDNDSIDSYDYFDVCSPECFIKQLSESIDKMDGRNSAEIADMPLPFAKKLLQKLTTHE